MRKGDGELGQEGKGRCLTDSSLGGVCPSSGTATQEVLRDPDLEAHPHALQDLETAQTQTLSYVAVPEDGHTPGSIG
jgi:hypothetical protein